MKPFKRLLVGILLLLLFVELCNYTIALIKKGLRRRTYEELRLYRDPDPAARRNFDDLDQFLTRPDNKIATPVANLVRYFVYDTDMACMPDTVSEFIRPHARLLSEYRQLLLERRTVYPFPDTISLTTRIPKLMRHLDVANLLRLKIRHQLKNREYAAAIQTTRLLMAAGTTIENWQGPLIATLVGQSMKSMAAEATKECLRESPRLGRHAFSELADEISRACLNDTSLMNAFAYEYEEEKDRWRRLAYEPLVHDVGEDSTYRRSQRIGMALFYDAEEVIEWAHSDLSIMNQRARTPYHQLDTTIELIHDSAFPRKYSEFSGLLRMMWDHPTNLIGVMTYQGHFPRISGALKRRAEAHAKLNAVYIACVLRDMERLPANLDALKLPDKITRNPLDGSAIEYERDNRVIQTVLSNRTIFAVAF